MAIRERSLALIGPGPLAFAGRRVIEECPELRWQARVASSAAGEVRRCRSAVLALPPLPAAAVDLAGHESAPWTFPSAGEMLRAGVVPELAIVGESAPEPADLRALLRLGVHVLVEPPLALGSAAATSLESLAERMSSVLCAASRFRACPAVRRARAWLADGIAGPGPLHIEGCTQDKSAPRPLSWLVAAIDAFDLSSSLAGPIGRLRLQGRSAALRLETEHTSGSQGSWDLHGHASSQAAPLARCIGSRAELWIGSALVARQSERVERLGPGHERARAEEHAVREWLGRVRSGEPAEDPSARTVCRLLSAFRRPGAWIYV